MPFRPYQADSQGRGQPQHIGNVLSELFVRRGYGRVQGAAAIQAAWRVAAGDTIADASRVGVLRRGTLEIVVANSLLSQELMFRKTQLLAELQRQLSADAVRNLRFRVGPVSEPPQ